MAVDRLTREDVHKLIRGYKRTRRPKPPLEDWLREKIEVMDLPEVRQAVGGDFINRSYADVVLDDLESYVGSSN